MGIFESALIVAAFFCTLVAGLVFTFAVVVMPGIKNLKDDEFLRAFQVMDRIIQQNQPLFMLVWIGSALALVVAAGFGFGKLVGIDLVLLILATVVYFFAVQLPTIAINIPLNNKLQTFEIDAMNEDECRRARAEFEPRWTRWNAIRTLFACAASVLLMVLLLRL